MKFFPIFVKTPFQMRQPLFFLTIVPVFFLFSFISKTTEVVEARDCSLTVAAADANLPDSVMQVVRTACMDCHSDDGSAFARGKLNFSKWSEYSEEKRIEKARDICDEMTKNGMPPKKWRNNNPDKIPTQAQTDLICRWASSAGK